jgi:predicted acylesterase/phospholipase RssA
MGAETGLDEADVLATYNEFMQHFLATAPPRTLNILALSGGGAGGAFGVGALVGNDMGGDRPQFLVVTGVSIGALIAPICVPGLIM